MAQRAAEVVIRAVEWHKRAAEVNVRAEEWHSQCQGGGVASRGAEVDVRAVERHGGRLRSLSGRWSGTEGG